MRGDDGAGDLSFLHFWGLADSPGFFLPGIFIILWIPTPAAPKLLIMNRFLLSIFGCLGVLSVFSQNFALESLEGHLDRVRVSHAAFSKKLTVIYQRDTLYLDDCTGIVSAHVLGKNFLELIYKSDGNNGEEGHGVLSDNGGAATGAETRNTAILTVSQGRLHAALVANSFHQDKSAGSAFLFSVAFHLTEGKGGHYRLMANIHDDSGAGGGDGAAMRADTMVTLQFDTTEKIFYSDRILVQKKLRVFEPGEGERKPYAIHERLAESILAGDTYYFYKGNWYIELMDDNWSKLTYQRTSSRH